MKDIHMKLFIVFLSLTLGVMSQTQTIVFGAGCFWGVEKHFEKLDGVLSAKSGYSGGNYENPTYATVLKYRNAKGNKLINHTEVVEVVYDDTIITTQDIIKSFWELHNPTQGNRQGNDRGNNYRSALYYTNDAQKDLALRTKSIYQNLLHKEGFGLITTEIKPLDTFYLAETYHQNYLSKNPFGYCPKNR